MSLNAVRRYAFSGRSRTMAYWVCTALVLFELCLGGAWHILRVPQLRELMDCSAPDRLDSTEGVSWSH